MAIELRQQLRLTQQLVMTPQLQQAIKLLQLSRQELVEEVSRELVENPVLEEVNFWRRLEGGIAVLFGVSKRPDATVSLKPRRPRNAAIPRLSFNLFRPL